MKRRNLIDHLITKFFLFVIMLSFGLTINAQTPVTKDKLRLTLPPAIYAVPGYEMNIYFDNIVLTPNIKNYNIDVDCKCGKQDQDRWRFTPTEKEVGNFPLSIKIYNDSDELIGEASTTVYVSPADAGKDKNISVMIVGDSITAANFYPRELDTLFKKPGNPDVKFIGSYTGDPGGEGFPLIEGYGGWKWASFCTKWVEGTPKSFGTGSSPFLVMKDGKPVLDFKAYCDKKNEGKAPDYITIALGPNDVFHANDSNIEQTIDDMFKNADTLIAEFRKVGPNTKIGIGIIPPPAASQDAFGESYKCGVPRFQYRKNQHITAGRIINKFAGREKENLFLIPVFVNLDCVNNFNKRGEQVNARNPSKIIRDCNGVHPIQSGYYQIADSFYAWFKYELNKKD